MRKYNKVLVIGGAGYLGTVLVQNLLDNGYYIRVLDNFIYGNVYNGEGLISENLEITRGDIRHAEVITEAISGIDAVIHLAAVVGDPAARLKPELTTETNYLASLMVASACRISGINKFIYASTCSVYGTGEDKLDEKSPLNPVSLYARTKISSEESIMSISDSRFKPTIMRMATLYGYSPRMRFDLVVNTMTKSAFTDGVIRVYGGSQWRPLLSLKDAARSYRLALESDINLTGGQVYNIGSEDQNYRISELADEIAGVIHQHSGRKISVITEKSITDERDYRVSFEKASRDLGFKAEFTVKDAVIEIWDRLAGGEIKDPSSRVYYNHYFDSSENIIG